MNFMVLYFYDFRKSFWCYWSWLVPVSIYGMSDNALGSFQSYLTNRQQCVSVGTKTSSLSTLMFAVPHGSVLGLILFSLYINVLLLYIKALCELFADDTFLHIHHKNLDTLMNSSQQLTALSVELKWITWPYIQTKVNSCLYPLDKKDKI